MRYLKMAYNSTKHVVKTLYNQFCDENNPGNHTTHRENSYRDSDNDSLGYYEETNNLTNSGGDRHPRENENLAGYMNRVYGVTATNINHQTANNTSNINHQTRYRPTVQPNGHNIHYTYINDFRSYENERRDNGNMQSPRKSTADNNVKLLQTNPMFSDTHALAETHPGDNIVIPIILTEQKQNHQNNKWRSIQDYDAYRDNEYHLYLETESIQYTKDENNKSIIDRKASGVSVKDYLIVESGFDKNTLRKYLQEYKITDHGCIAYLYHKDGNELSLKNLGYLEKKDDISNILSNYPNMNENLIKNPYICINNPNSNNIEQIITKQLDKKPGSIFFTMEESKENVQGIYNSIHQTKIVSEKFPKILDIKPYLEKKLTEYCHSNDEQYQKYKDIYFQRGDEQCCTEFINKLSRNKSPDNIEIFSPTIHRNAYRDIGSNGDRDTNTGWRKNLNEVDDLLDNLYSNNQNHQNYRHI